MRCSPGIGIGQRFWVKKPDKRPKNLALRDSLPQAPASAFRRTPQSYRCNFWMLSTLLRRNMDCVTIHVCVEPESHRDDSSAEASNG
jgi:hypothetical protein